VYYATLVRKAEQQTYFFLLEQQNDIYAEFESCLKMAWVRSQGEMVYLLIGHRDLVVPVKMREKFNKAFVTSVDTAENLAALVAELIQGVKDILLDLQDIHKVFYEYSLRLLRDDETESRLRDEYRF
jgi:hypothetical protein